jgi:hypothetical protein
MGESLQVASHKLCPWRLQLFFVFRQYFSISKAYMFHNLIFGKKSRGSAITASFGKQK